MFIAPIVNNLVSKLVKITNWLPKLHTSLYDKDIFPIAFLGSEEILHLEADSFREILRLNIS